MISGLAAWAHRHKAPGWARTPETPARGPHLKPWVGAQPDQWLAPQVQRPKAADRQRNPGPKQQKDRPRVTQAQSRRSAYQRPDCLPGTTPKTTGSEQLLPSPCPQSPAEPTGSLGLQQNTQQRGAAGLGETAFPEKTRPSRGLNYPIAAPGAPSI